MSLKSVGLQASYNAPMFEPHEPQITMSFGDHLEELRRRVILALLGVAVAAGVMLLIGRQLVRLLCQPLFAAQRLADLSAEVYNFAPGTAFSIYLKVCLIGGLVVASPWVFWQAWKFISAGLYHSERRVVLFIGPFSAVMVALSMLFMYFIMLPICIWFLIGFATSYPPVGQDDPGFVMRWIGQTVRKDQPADPAIAASDPALVPIVTDDPTTPREGQMWIKSPQGHLRIYIGGQTRNFVPATGDRSLMRPLIDINEYISFVMLLTLGNLVAFQMPVFIFILGWTGLVDPKLLAKYRRHCVFACFALGMVLTPADPLSMLVLAFPLWGLYELGMLAANRVYPRGDDPAV